MKKDTSKKYIAKYFHSDGNGIHLIVGKTYKVKYNDEIAYIKVIEEYKHFYLAEYNKKYNISINKYHDDFKILSINK